MRLYISNARKGIGVFLIALTIASCHPYHKPHAALDAKFKSIYNYTVGSYWIMQDSLTGEIDSFWVASKNQQPDLEDQFGTYERKKLTLFEQKKGDSYKGITWVLSFSQGYIGGLDYLNPISQDTFFVGSVAYPIPHADSMTAVYGHLFAGIDTIVHGKFYQTTHISNAADYSIYFPSYCYPLLIENYQYGLIKIDLSKSRHPYIWELLYCHFNTGQQ